MKRPADVLLRVIITSALLIFTSEDAAARSIADAPVTFQPLQVDADPTIHVAIDPRVELISIIFRLAGNGEYNQNRFQGYVSAIETHFSTFRDHPAVEYARQMREKRGIGFDAPMSLAIHLTDVPDLEERVSFEASNLERRWQPDEARTFIEHARSFIAETDFESFIQAHQSLYELAETRMREVISNHVNQGWFAEFFGERPQARFNVVIGLSNGGANYGPRFEFADGSEELYSIMGTWLTDEEGQPVYDERIVGTIIHEFNHSFVNHVVANHVDDLREPGEVIYSLVAEQMRRQAYANWKTMFDESLVRTAVARYILAHKGTAAANQDIAQQKERGFLWIDELFMLMGIYENARERYDTFDAFFPNVTAYFRDLALRIDDVVDAYDAKRPRVIAMMPANRSQDLDPNLSEISFRFDRPMVRDSWSLMTSGENAQEHYPEVESVGFDETGTVFTMNVQLKPNWSYRFSLNSETGGAFRSQEGLTLVVHQVQFRTAGKSD